MIKRSDEELEAILNGVADDDDYFYRYRDEFNLTEKEAVDLVKRNRRELARWDEEEIKNSIKNTWDGINNYIANNGLPETSEHDDLYGDALDKYYEKNGGPNFEDCRVIIED